MLPLSPRIVQRIEGLLEPGYFVQVEQVGNTVEVFKVPKGEDTLHCPPAHATANQKATLAVTVQLAGDDPAQLAAWQIDAECWVKGVIVSKTPPGEE